MQMAYYRKIAPTVALELTIGIINYTEVAVNGWWFDLEVYYKIIIVISPVKLKQWKTASCDYDFF